MMVNPIGAGAAAKELAQMSCGFGRRPGKVGDPYFVRLAAGLKPESLDHAIAVPVGGEGCEDTFVRVKALYSGGGHDTVKA